VIEAGTDRLRHLGRRAAVRGFGLRWRPRACTETIRLGSGYGGWWIPREVDSSWTCYTVGVGEDASFDQALAEMGCEVLAIDPTPRAVNHMQGLVALHPNLSLAEYAVWCKDTELDFFPPADPQHVSYSLTNRQQTRDPIRVPARTLPSIAREFGHERIDLLKLDIEGAEYEVLDSLDLRHLGVRVLCVEFHDDQGVRRMSSAVRSVVSRGYRVISVERTDVTFRASASD
jgi:FkbM family methyltransferase